MPLPRFGPRAFMIAAAVVGIAFGAWPGVRFLVNWYHTSSWTPAEVEYKKQATRMGVEERVYEQLEAKARASGDLELAKSYRLAAGHYVRHQRHWMAAASEAKWNVPNWFIWDWMGVSRFFPANRRCA